jgi:SAM-dependent methyltransferase
MKSTSPSCADSPDCESTRSELADLQKLWHRLGSVDPLWAVLTQPDKRGNRWTVDEFLATGAAEIRSVMRQLEDFQIRVARGRALDFGCGAGRLTQALGEFFDQTYGIDISPSMIERACELNRRGEKCTFHVNGRADLGLFPEDYFDFVYTNIVLQHIHPRYSLAYIREFVRVLRPGGVAVFQLPTHPANTAMGLLLRILPLRAVRIIRKMDMYGVPAYDVAATIEESGAVLLTSKRDQAAGRHWISVQYFVQKPFARQA